MRLRTYDDDGKRRLLLQIFGTGADHVLDTERVVELRDALTAWIDAPRLAARANPEIIARDVDGAMALVRTPYEWGALPIVDMDDADPHGEMPIGDIGPSRVPLAIGYDPAIHPCATWFSGDRAEHDARSLYAEERDKSYCGECKREVDGDLHQLGEDGPDACEDCHAQARAEWLASDVACTEDGCGWSGKGAECDDGACPKCGGEVEEVASLDSQAVAP